MLYEFLTTNREVILNLTKEKTLEISESKPSSKELEKGLPVFYDRLITTLTHQAHGGGKQETHPYSSSTTRHGKESQRLGYSVSQVVHGYGAICQAITETAQKLGASISAKEFSALNLSLDVAIADAVTGFSSPSHKAEKFDSTKRIGFLVHELRNALACAIVAHSMIKRGVVGIGGSTNALLERNLQRMRHLLDRSFSEIRLQNDPEADRHPMFLIEAIDEVVATAGEDARLRGLTLTVEVDSKLEVNVDRNYLISAVANLVQNAIKFCKKDGTVWVRSLEGDKNIVLEVEDQCGGLPKGKADELFQPFTQKNGDRSGLGLGLSISRRAIARNGGTLSVRDIPGTGCVFFISLPKEKQKHPAHDRKKV